jgi:hypothetical protein
MIYLLDRLKEPSTWRGLIGLLTGFGIVIKPELADAIIAVGVGLIGLINVIRKEYKP